jgi:hypothetical protein
MLLPEVLSILVVQFCTKGSLGDWAVCLMGWGRSRSWGMDGVWELLAKEGYMR